MAMPFQTTTNINILTSLILSLTLVNSAAVPNPKSDSQRFSHDVESLNRRLPLVRRDVNAAQLMQEIAGATAKKPSPEDLLKDIGNVLKQYKFSDIKSWFTGERLDNDGKSSGAKSVTVALSSSTSAVKSFSLEANKTTSVSSSSVIVEEIQSLGATSVTLDATSTSLSVSERLTDSSTKSLPSGAETTNLTSPDAKPVVTTPLYTTKSPEEEETFSILPWFPSGESISDNVTEPIPTEAPVISDDFPNEPTLGITSFILPEATETAYPSSTSGEEFFVSISILPYIPNNEHITDNATSLDVTAVPEITSIATPSPVGEDGGILSILPYVTGNEQLTDNVTYPEATETSVEEVIATPILVTGNLNSTNILLPSATGFGASSNLDGSTVDEDTRSFTPLIDYTPPPALLPTPSGEVYTINDGSVNITRTKPWILTNPLRPTESPMFSAEDDELTTITQNIKTTRFIYVTVVPTPVGMNDTFNVPNTLILTAASGSPVSETETSISSYKEVTTNPSFFVSIIGSPTSNLSFTNTIPTDLVPSPTSASAPDNVTDSNTNLTSTIFSQGALDTLNRICKDPQIQTISLPLLSRFYGPNAYPSLSTYPGCAPPNVRQRIQAPGLLNCSALGAQIQACQRNGRQVLLSVKLDSPLVVNGNVNYGKPGVAPPSDFPYPYPYPLPRPVNPHSPPSSSNPPNLFDSTHPPSPFALTLFSLFGAGDTERADLRPLGPDINGNSMTKDAITWLNRPLGEEVVIDGYDIRIPKAWEGTYEGGQIDAFVERLRELEREAWANSGEVEGGAADYGAKGPGRVLVAYE